MVSPVNKDRKDEAPSFIAGINDPSKTCEGGEDDSRRLL